MKHRKRHTYKFPTRFEAFKDNCKKFIKRLTYGTVISLPFVAAYFTGNMVKEHTSDYLLATKYQVRMLEKYQKDPGKSTKLDSLETDLERRVKLIENTNPFNLFSIDTQFGEAKAIWEGINNDTGQYLKTSAREIDVGLAYDIHATTIGPGINNANHRLKDLGIKLTIKEYQDIHPTSNFFKDDYSYGVRGAFENEHELYVVSSWDLYDKKKKILGVIGPHGTVGVYNTEMSFDSLGALITEQVMRRLELTPEDTVLFTIPNRSVDSKVELITSRIGMPLRYSRTNTAEDDSTLCVSAFVCLDEVEKAYANTVLTEAAKILEDKFKIYIDFKKSVEVKLESDISLTSFGNNLDMMLKDSAYHHIILTSQDWGIVKGSSICSKKDSVEKSMAGLSDFKTHNVLIEVQPNLEETVLVILHELLHTYGARHIFVDGCLMYPISQNPPLRIMPLTYYTVLRNKGEILRENLY